ncbi:MAG: hypothetical protein BECKG1743E_GA0114224_112062, partial [Candidatus Kentron sp. G]
MRASAYSTLLQEAYLLPEAVRSLSVYHPPTKKLFGNSQSTAVAPELRPCVTTGGK